ncbi:methyl-accepting chemotaxis protein [Chitinimonas sp. BJYL2]|uniref:methyl-accepting chemotaxis protein n=1 Tax=Chitinimonas sp. BJYL2 TaxID=2976696 RepID=UPI0022B31D95|nr:methyl-accepting chemotaxis protein [Chitinimonas sp. BJYL2]
MFSNWSVQKKILVSVALILLASLLTVGLVSARLFKTALTERLEQYELVRTVEAIRNELDKSVSVPLSQAQQLAANTFVLDWMAAGEPAEGVPLWQRYAKRLKEQSGAAMVSWTSETTRNYYNDEKGVARQVDPDGADGWFKAFLASGQSHGFNLGAEPGKPNVMMFINTLAKDDKGQRAVASLGIDVTAMADRVRQMAIGKSGQVFVVDEAGKIQIHRDPALVKVDNKVDLASLPGMTEVAPTLLNKGNFNLGHYRSPNGPMVVVSSHLPTAGWFVVVEIAEAEVYGPVTRTMQWMVVIDLVILLVSLALIFYVTTTITQPLGKLRDAMRSLTSGQGDLTVRLNASSGDEIGEIAKSFNQFMEQLRSMFLRVRDQTHHLNSSVEQLGQMTDHLSEGSRDSASLAEATAATIEQITVSVAHIADNTRAAAHTVEQAGALSADSAESVGRVSGEISHVSQSMDVLAGVMSDLEARSGQVSSIASVIKEIADQTNLLALNAAIEAARAGEQGRGFAVVADEVRKLAERTGQATLEIDKMVGSMRQATEQALSKVGQTHDSVRSGVDLVDVALAHIAKIQVNMAEVITKTTEIRDAATEQSRATEEMARAAERMSARAQEGDAELHRTSQVIDQLEQLSVELNQVVDSFRL